MSSARWYIIHAYSGFEKKVAAAIEEQAKVQGLSDFFEEIVVPTEEVVEVRKGKKITTERNLMPGYILAKMHMTDASISLVTNTSKVTGFLGSGTRPSPVSDAEADQMLNRSGTQAAAPRPNVQYEIGEEVRVSDGPFTSFNGMVEEIDEERARLKVSVSIFGRPTPVELEYTQVEKV